MLAHVEVWMPNPNKTRNKKDIIRALRRLPVTRVTPFGPLQVFSVASIPYNFRSFDNEKSNEL